MESKASQHLKEEMLEAYAENSLPETELSSVEEHLLFCESCQDRLEEVEHYTRAMRGAALRIREEEQQERTAPAAQIHAPGFWDRLRGWLPAPRVWAGALAMAGVILIVGLQVGQKTGPPIEVELQAVRGPAANTAVAGHTLNLRLDSHGVPEMPAWQIEIVDEEGAQVWKGTGTWSDTWIRASVEKSLKPGTYFVRLLKPGETPAREYQLIIHP